MSRSLSIIDKEYFEWMYSIVCDGKRISYRKLLSYLHDREFVYSIEMDGNRAEDGIDLRDRFVYECYRGNSVVSDYLSDGPCSILEMMVALVIRCEEHIMDDPDIGDRTSQWFWVMIDSLGLESMDDIHFNKKQAEQIVDRFLNREYKENGEGGLFTIRNCRYDMRTIDIWYQMCWYLHNI